MVRSTAIGLVVVWGSAQVAAQQSPPTEATHPAESQGDEARLAAPQPTPPEAPPALERGPTLRKVAVVIVGDPDPDLERGAAEVRAALTDVVRFPSDATLDAALRGAAGSEDGLERLRAERRSLGLDEATDIPILVRLGRLAAADLLLLVRQENAQPGLVVFHVGRAGYLAGSLALTRAGSQAIRDFVRARIGDPAPAPGPPASPPSPAAPTREREPSSVRPDVETLSSPSVTAGPADADEDPNWFEDHWPLLVGGALLLGVILWFAWPSGDETAAPTLRFVPGS